MHKAVAEDIPCEILKQQSHTVNGHSLGKVDSHLRSENSERDSEVSFLKEGGY